MFAVFCSFGSFGRVATAVALLEHVHVGQCGGGGGGGNKTPVVHCAAIVRGFGGLLKLMLESEIYHLSAAQT